MNTVNEIYKDAEKHLSEANSYYKAGLVSELDVMRAKAKLSEVKQKIVKHFENLFEAEFTFQ